MAAAAFVLLLSFTLCLLWLSVSLIALAAKNEWAPRVRLRRRDTYSTTSTSTATSTATAQAAAAAHFNTTSTYLPFVLAHDDNRHDYEASELKLSKSSSSPSSSSSWRLIGATISASSSPTSSSSSSSAAHDEWLSAERVRRRRTRQQPQQHRTRRRRRRRRHKQHNELSWAAADSAAAATASATPIADGEGGDGEPEEGEPDSAAAAAAAAEQDATNGIDETNNQTSNNNAQPEIMCESREQLEREFPSWPVRIAFTSGYACVFLVGLNGNLLTLLAMCRKLDKLTSLDIFIANLALSDIMQCLFTLPITPIYILFHGNWTFGHLLCKAFAFAQCASVYISTLTMINIAYVRYMLIVHPLKAGARMSKKVALLLNVLTWTLGFAITLPYLLHVQVMPEECKLQFCDENWGRDDYRFIFSVVTLTMQFFTPFASVTFFYGTVFNTLRQRAKRQRGQHANLGAGLSTAAATCSQVNHRQQQQQQQQQPQLSDAGAAAAAAADYSSEYVLAAASATRKSGGRQAALPSASPPSPSPSPLSDSIQMCEIAHAHSQNHHNHADERSKSPHLRVDHPATGPISTEISSVTTSSQQQQQQQQQQLQSQQRLNELLAAREMRQRERDRRAQQTNIKLLCMVVLFVFSWLPLNLFHLIQDYAPESLANSAYTKHMFLAVHLVACSSVCFNPILYAWMSDNYRQEIMDILHAFARR